MKLIMNIQQEMKRNSGDKMCILVITVISALFITFGEGNIGYVLGGDSEAYYIHFRHHIGVAPLYPLFIHVINLLVGEAYYLNVAAAVQIAFLVYSIIFFVNTIRQEFRLKWYETILVWGASMLPFVILLPEDPIGHTIMTESFTYPLTYLTMTFLIKGIFRQGEKDFIISLVLCIISGLIRSQMLFLFVVTGAAYFYMVIRRCQKRGERSITSSKFWIRIAVACMITLLGMKSVSWLTIVYEKVFFDAPAVAYSDQTLVQHMLYLADGEDERLFEDEHIREIFIRCYQGMMEQESNYIHQEEGLAAWQKIVGDCGANSYLLTEVIEEYYGSMGTLPEDPIEKEVLIADISHQLAYPLLKVHWQDKAAEAFDLIPAGFVSTVLFHKLEIYGIIHIATLLFYVIGTLLACFYYSRRKEDKRAAELILLFFFASAVNVIACNIVHFGLQRYLAYTMGLNWAGILLLLRGFKESQAVNSPFSFGEIFSGHRNRKIQ